MIRRKIVCMGIFIIAVASLSYTQILDKTIATVSLYKTENISKTKFDKQLRIWAKQTNQPITDEVRDKVLEATINDMLISQAAKKAGIVATNQQVTEAVERQKLSLGTPISDGDLKVLIQEQTGLQWEEYRKQIRNRILQEQYIYKKYKDKLEQQQIPTAAEIKETYYKFAQNFTNPAMVRVSNLFWESETASKEALQQAEASNKKIKGNAKVFDEYLDKSFDDTSFEGGDLGFIVWEEKTARILGSQFLDALFSLKENEVSNVIKSNLGYHIVKITDKREAKLLKLNDPIFPGEKTTVEDRVKDILSSQKQQDYFLQLVQTEVDSLRKTAKIKIITKNF